MAMASLYHRTLPPPAIINKNRAVFHTRMYEYKKDKKNLCLIQARKKSSQNNFFFCFSLGQKILKFFLKG